MRNDWYTRYATAPGVTQVPQSVGPQETDQADAEAEARAIILGKLGSDLFADANLPILINRMATDLLDSVDRYRDTALKPFLGTHQIAPPTDAILTKLLTVIMIDVSTAVASAQTNNVAGIVAKATNTQAAISQWLSTLEIPEEQIAQAKIALTKAKPS